MVILTLVPFFLSKKKKELQKNCRNILKVLKDLLPSNDFFFDDAKISYCSANSTLQVAIDDIY